MPSLTPNQQKFILHWGEMGTKWGVNRSVAQTHALLYISDSPRNAEEIAETLSMARSNVSNCIKELQSWGLIRIVHVLGDRRDHFESLTDVWEMFQRVMDERKRREIDPTMRLLRECLAESKKSDGVTRDRLEAMLDFFQTMDSWYGHFRRLPRQGMIRFAKLGSKLGKIVGAA